MRTSGPARSRDSNVAATEVGLHSGLGRRLDEVVEAREREPRERAPHDEPRCVDDEADAGTAVLDRSELDLSSDALGYELKREPMPRHDVGHEQRPGGTWPLEHAEHPRAERQDRCRREDVGPSNLPARPG